MAEFNEIEDIIVPDSPKVEDGEQYYFYVPIASYAQKGIVTFNPKYFQIIDGIVDFIPSLLRLDLKADLIEGNVPRNQLPLAGYDNIGKGIASFDSNSFIVNDGLVYISNDFLEKVTNVISTDDVSNLPKTGNSNRLYIVKGMIYYWDVDTYKPVIGGNGGNGGGSIPGISSGDVDDSLVIFDGISNGRYSIAIGTDDTSFFENIEDLKDLKNSSKPEVSGEKSIGFGIGTKSKSFNTVNFGVDSAVGAKGYYINSYDFLLKRLILSINKDDLIWDETLNWEKGDNVLGTYKNTLFYGDIEDVIGNQVILKTPFSFFEMNGGYNENGIYGNWDAASLPVTYDYSINDTYNFKFYGYIDGVYKENIDATINVTYERTTLYIEGTMVFSVTSSMSSNKIDLSRIDDNVIGFGPTPQHVYRNDEISDYWFIKSTKPKEYKSLNPNVDISGGYDISTNEIWGNWNISKIISNYGAFNGSFKFYGYINDVYIENADAYFQTYPDVGGVRLYVNGEVVYKIEFGSRNFSYLKDDFLSFGKNPQKIYLNGEVHETGITDFLKIAEPLTYDYSEYNAVNTVFAFNVNENEDGKKDVTIKDGKIDLGHSSVSIGIGNALLAKYSDVLGAMNFAIGQYANIQGNNNVGSSNSVTRGNYNTNLSEHGYVNGENNVTDFNSFQYVIGRNNRSNSKFNVVLGEDNIVKAPISVVLGRNNELDLGGKGSVLIGENLICNAPNQLLFGQYNVKDDNMILIYGNGNSQGRKNIFSIDKEGNFYANKFFTKYGNYNYQSACFNQAFSGYISTGSGGTGVLDYSYISQYEADMYLAVFSDGINRFYLWLPSNYDFRERMGDDVITGKIYRYSGFNWQITSSSPGNYSLSELYCVKFKEY